MHEQVIGKQKRIQDVSRGTIKNPVDFVMFHVEQSILRSTWNNFKALGGVSRGTLRASSLSRARSAD
jgi:hypothetical protein